MSELFFKDEVYPIVGAAIEVHRHLKGGFLEAIYQEALELEFAERGVPFRPRAKVQVFYKGRPLKKEFIADAICYEQIFVELKVMEVLTSREEAQLLNYMYATRMKVGVLINFGDQGRLDWKRFVL